MKNEFEIPEFYSPFRAEISPHLEQVRPRLLDWARTVGIVKVPGKDAGHDAWREEEFTATDFTKFVALTHPYSSANELELLACWYAVTWYIDDLIVPARRPLMNREEVLRWVESAISFLQEVPGRAPISKTPLEVALANVWARTVPSTSCRWRERYRRAYQEFLYALVWEVDNLSHARSADLVQQVEMRRDYGAALTGALLAEHALGLDFPQQITESLAFRLVTNAFRDTVDLHNDIFSYLKELREGEAPNNVVSVVQQLFDLPLTKAVHHVDTILTGRVMTLENALRTEIPLMLNDIGADEEHRLSVRCYVQALQAWVAGSYRWHKETARYTGSHSNQSGRLWESLT